MENIMIINKTTTRHAYDARPRALIEREISVDVVTVRGIWVNKLTNARSPYVAISLRAFDVDGETVAIANDIGSLTRAIVRA
jgi:hypothetical protein